jgi:replication initiator protein
MGRVHRLLEEKGKRDALQFGLDRREVETAAAYMADENSGIGYLYSNWCQAALPHKRLPDDEGWQVKADHLTLLVQPGMRPSETGKPVAIGVPYGSRARLIMLYLQSEALRTGRREVELGKNLKTWLNRLNIPVGGKSYEQVRDQAERIGRCSLTFEVRRGQATGLVNQSIVDTAIFLDRDDRADGRQGSLFIETARLSEAFFEQLRKHPVPLEEAAIKRLSNNSMALDIYAWLAYRLHSLEGERTVSWRALKPQFGAGYSRLDNFRTKYLDNLKLALAVYPEAKVEVGDGGLLLHPSRPPVSKRDTVVAVRKES